jgi:hypothetical protein
MTVKLLIESKLHSLLVNELFEQTEDYFKIPKNLHQLGNFRNIDKFMSVRAQKIPMA